MNLELRPKDGLNLVFYQDGKAVGLFWFDEKTESFRFEGTVDKSAKIFVEYVIKLMGENCDSKTKL